MKYRSRGRPRTVEGAQVHGHTRLELIWTAIPVVILASSPPSCSYELPKISEAPAATDTIHITVEGHQYYWQFDYSPNHSRSIGTLHVPVGEVVDLKVVSPDVIHSWWIPALGGKIQAIPGRTNHTWFKAEKAGSYEGQCAELCGVFHASMRATVRVESQRALPALRLDLRPGDDRPAGCGAASARPATAISARAATGRRSRATRSSSRSAALEGILRNGVTSSIGRDAARRPDVDPAADRRSLSYVKRHIYKAALGTGATSGG